jgi:hypothetical protein
MGVAFGEGVAKAQDHRSNTLFVNCVVKESDVAGKSRFEWEGFGLGRRKFPDILKIPISDRQLTSL